jgi:carbohydrate diacid regulator
MPDAAISPEEVLDTLEADAMTSAGITVSRVCARAEQIHARYLELDEAEEAAERLHLGTRVVRVEKMFFQQFLWRNRQGFAKEKTVSPLIEDSILKETARAFLNSDLNVTTAAEKLGIHRNTLLYRLNRIEVETGIDLKRFDDAAGYYFSEMLDKFHKIVKEAD